MSFFNELNKDYLNSITNKFFALHYCSVECSLFRTKHLNKNYSYYDMR